MDGGARGGWCDGGLGGTGDWWLVVSGDGGWRRDAGRGGRLRPMSISSYLQTK
jgi:hypothetical protein